MWLKNKAGYYVAEIHGVNYVTWVSERNKSHAAVFPEYLLSWWMEIVGKMTGEVVESVRPTAV